MTEFQTWDNVGSDEINRRFKLVEEGIPLPLSILKELLVGQINHAMLSPELKLFFRSLRNVDRYIVTVAGAGQIFTLSATAVTNSELIFVNGDLLKPGADYTLVGDTLTILATLGIGDFITAHYAITSTVVTAFVEGTFPTAPMYQHFNAVVLNTDIFVRGKDATDGDLYKVVKFNAFSFASPDPKINVQSGVPDNRSLIVVGGSVWAIGSPSTALTNRIIKINPANMNVDFDFEVVPSTDSAAVISALASDGAGFMYAYIKGGVVAPHKIAKINTVGVPVITGTIVSGIPTAALVGSVDMMINQSGNLFVSWSTINGGAGQVCKYDVGTGILLKTYAFSQPIKLTRVFDKIYIIDAATYKLWQIPASGNPVEVITFASQPTAIQFDGSDLWVAFGQDLVKMKPDSTTLSTFSPLVTGQTIQDLTFGLGDIWAIFADDTIAGNNVIKIFPGLSGS